MYKGNFVCEIFPKHSASEAFSLIMLQDAAQKKHYLVMTSPERAHAQIWR